MLPIVQHTDYSLRSLRRFLSLEAVTDAIIRRTNAPKKHHENCRKQARQIGYCLRQAFSYLEAAAEVGDETRPLLLYYACTSLASVEVLWNGDGDRSLDKLRAEYGAHGLELACGQLQKKNPAEWLSELRARPSKQSGLFHLWSAHSAEDCVVGRSIAISKEGISTSGANAALRGEDTLPSAPPDGCTMRDILCAVPRMSQFLSDARIAQDLVRGKIEILDDHRSSTRSMVVTIHPTRRDLVALVEQAMMFHPSEINNLKYQDAPGGFILTWTRPTNIDGPWNIGSFPSAISHSASELYFRTTLNWLNEFGVLYVGLFIAGMICRYHPDSWMRVLDEGAHGGLLVSEFCRIAAERLPVLAVNALEGAIVVCD